MTNINVSGAPLKKLAIIGAGGHAKVVMETAILMKQWTEIAFIDDFHNSRKEFMGFPLLGDSSLLGQSVMPNEYDVVVAIGDNDTRGRVFELAEEQGFSLPCIYHPTAVISMSAKIGAGSVFFAQTAVNAEVSIGKGAIINTSSSVDHDSVLGDFVHVSPGARLAGNTSVGDFSWVGIGSCTREGSAIGRHCVIGAGASVVSDIPDGMTAVGIPAKQLVKR
ncbi:MAG: acetyltransferase [Neisseria sp.]|uniref:acetyltransferase n=1 Tax=Neisseria sp. TaxID=192066 RepID=UPI0026DD9F5F|nr:acetyltransferase [Neisseria sp.]MDO4640486.1 acetyltransferase [Neisseria sp.]